MNVDTSLAVGVVVTLLALAIAGFTVYRYRGVPMTREELLEKRIEDLEATVRILQERIRELEDELEIYKVGAIARPAVPRRRTTVRPKAKRLTGEQLHALREELLGAYTTHSQWQTLLQDTDHMIDAVAIGTSLNDVAAKALAQANAEGWIDELIKTAVDGRPDLAALKTLAAELAKVLQ